MLAALDDAAIKNGAPINIKSGAKEQFDLDELREKTQYVVEGEQVDDSSAHWLKRIQSRQRMALFATESGVPPTGWRYLL
jgi:hypothetical protein